METPNTEIHMDLFADYARHLADAIRRNGYTVEQADPETVVMAFLNLRKRLVTRRPRRAHVSTDLASDQRHGPALAAIKSKIEAGADLSPYLSKLILDADKLDPMLNDWGVHHLHLGDLEPGSAFVTRTGPLLFARFEDDDAYLIGIYDHSSWAKQGIVEAMHKSWPSLLERFRVNNAIGLSHKYEDHEHAQLRKANINIVLQMKDGTVYMPPGGGQLLSGHPAEAMLGLTSLRRKLDSIEREIRKRVSEQPEFEKLESATYRLIVEDGSALVVSEAHEMSFRLEDLAIW